MKIFSFDPFSLHLGRYELTRGSTVLSLPRVPMEILILLVERQGDLLTRREIAGALWPESDPDDVVQSINTAINRIRAVLRDDAAKPKYVQTVIGKGYRFIAPVEVVPLNVVEEALPAQGPEQLESIPLPDSRRPVRLRLWMWAVPCFLLLLAVFFFLHLRNRAIAQHNPQASYISPTRFTTNTSENRVTATAISPDGRLIAYADADGVALQAIGDPAPHPVRAPEMRAVDWLAWFPDGLHLALSGTEASSGKLAVWVVSVTGDRPVMLREDARLGVPSPDGSLLAFTNGNGSEVWLTGAAGESPRRLIAGQTGEYFPVVVWSKSGKRLLLARHTPNPLGSHFPPDSPETRQGFQTTYLAADVATGKVTASEGGIRISHACLLQDDEMLFSRPEPHAFGGSTSLWRVRLNPATGGFASAPVKLQDFKNLQVRALTIAAQTGELAAIFARGGPVVFVGSLNTSTHTLNDVKRLSLDTSNAYPHAWMPDSSAVLYESNHGGRYQIYKQRIDRHDPEAIITTSEEQSVPRVSPDRDWILFSSKAQNTSARFLLRVPLEGGSPTAVNTGGPLGDFRCPLFGKACVLRKDENHQRSIFFVLDPMTGKGPHLFTAPLAWDDFGDWDVSPDGSMIAMVSPGSVLPEIRTVLLASGQTREVPLHIGERVTGINWAVDQKGWFVAGSTTTGSDLFYVDRQGEAFLLHQTTSATWGVPSPDGKKLAFVEQDLDSNVWLLHPDKNQ